MTARPVPNDPTPQPAPRPSPLSDEQRGWIRDIAASLRAPTPRDLDADETLKDGRVSSPARAFAAGTAPAASRA